MGILLLAISLLLNAVQYSSCKIINIVPSPDSPCPGEFTAGEPCFTLEQYVAYPTSISDITFELHPGSHRLDSQLSISDINSFTMRAINTLTTVTCSQRYNEPFNFIGLQQIHVSGITFDNYRMILKYITNATFERNLFVNGTCCPYEGALSASYSSVLIRLCIISNNSITYGAISGDDSSFRIELTTFRNNTYFKGTCCNSHGGAIYLSNGNLEIFNSIFIGNSPSHHDGHGGAIYAYSSKVNFINTYFSDNRAGKESGHGGAIYFNGGNITVTNCTFTNNTASTGGGGAIYLDRDYTTILSLVNNLFSFNSAAYCGVMEVSNSYHINITGSTFVYNKAMGQILGNTGGGVICVRNASISVLDNNFSHNSAAGGAGVIQVDESDIIIERSNFSNNTAGGNGGALNTYFYPTNYTIINSSFINNQAGGDGGVMYVGRAGSHVTTNQSTFGFNNAHGRGGVIAIIWSTLEIDRASIFENTATQGEVISECNSSLTMNPEDLAVYSSCKRSNITFATTTEPRQTTTTTGTITSDASTTTTFPPPDNITSTAVDITTTPEAIIPPRKVDPLTIVPGFVAILISFIATVLVIALCVKVFKAQHRYDPIDS